MILELVAFIAEHFVFVSSSLDLGSEVVSGGKNNPSTGILGVSGDEGGNVGMLGHGIPLLDLLLDGIIEFFGIILWNETKAFLEGDDILGGECFIVYPIIITFQSTGSSGKLVATGVSGGQSACKDEETELHCCFGGCCWGSAWRQCELFMRAKVQVALSSFCHWILKAARDLAAKPPNITANANCALLYRLPLLGHVGKILLIPTLKSRTRETQQKDPKPIPTCVAVPWRKS